MEKRPRLFFKCTLPIMCLLAALFLSGCGTPKKVKIYESTSDIRNKVVETAVSLHGNPYRTGAKGSNAFDCSGFVKFVFKKQGLNLPVSTDKQIKAGSEVSRDNVQPGDLVFFKIKKDLHVGIMINRKEFIHASKSRGIAVDDVEATYWRRSLLEFRTVLG
ncbi:MAG: endopeptidase [Syntrophus sp. (in: bacteria)]|nr:endopeptidase [Syntrophus sp. (in: bacteria)]